MVNNQFNMLTRIKRYFRIVTISCIMPISILGGRVSINQVGAEESLAEEYPSEISSGVTLSESTLPVEELDRNVALPNVPVLPNRGDTNGIIRYRDIAGNCSGVGINLYETQEIR